MNIPKLVERKFLFASDQPITAPLYEIVIAQNGVFKRAHRREMCASVEISPFAVKIPELAVETPRVQLIEIIPVGIFAEILAHAKSATDKANFTENLYAVCWNEENHIYFWQEISGSRAFGSTIARSNDAAYQNAILEIHTHPPGCRNFSGQDNVDESGKFRLFGILIDIHAEKPAIRLRVGIYDSFWEIPLESVTDAPMENLTDLVKEENERLAQVGDFIEPEGSEFMLTEQYSLAVHLSYLENL